MVAETWIKNILKMNLKEVQGEAVDGIQLNQKRCSGGQALENMTEKLCVPMRGGDPADYPRDRQTPNPLP